MDRKLQKPQPHNQIRSFLRLIQRSFLSNVSRHKYYLLVSLMAGASALQTGCQTQKLWHDNTALPVPPKVLDQETLQGVRFQSPGGSGSRSIAGTSFPEPPEQRESDILPDFEQLADTGDGMKPDVVKEVIITGNQHTPTHHLTRNIRTRQGRYFDPDKLQQDVNMLWRLPEIKKVKGPYLDRQADGVVIRIEVEERQKVSTVSFIGNRGISDRKLQKKSGLEDGSPMDVHSIRMAKTAIEELYKDEGYPRTQVEILDNEGNDNSVTFLIHEDQKQRIWKVNFEGNTIASEARLRSIVKSKPGIGKVLYGGLAKRTEIEQDIQRLTSYYRALGFFNAQVGREISESNDGRWLSLRFIINEGPRYSVRNVKFIGNQAFDESQLTSLVTMHPTKSMPDFNVAIMNEDLKEIRDLYGSQGFVFSDIKVETRFLEEPGLVDLVYKIKEGKQYRVGQVNVKYDGGNSVTKSSVIRNRIDLRPGDLIDMRKIEASKARLTRSQIFAAGQGGAPPAIAIKPRELKDIESHADLDNAPSSYKRTARESGSPGSSGGSSYR
jgi:outer membrane protein insertion porin family